MSEKPKAFGFARVSSDEQARGGISLGLQAEAIRTYCEQKGYEVVRVVEVAETASFSDERVEFQALLAEYAARDDVQHLVFYKVDRSNRNIWDHAKLADLVIRRRKSLHAALDHFHLHPDAPPSEWDRFDMMALFARSETRHLSSRVRSCLKQQVSMGLYAHKAPPGYRKIPRGGIEIDPVQGPLVRQWLELAASGGWSIDMLTDKAREFGITYQGKPVIRSSVHRWLGNPVFAGPFYFNGQLVTNYQHTPLISWDTHKKIAERITRYDRTKKKVRTKEYPLAGVFKCGYCERSVTFFIAKKRYTYGVCTGCRRQGFSPKNVTEEELFGQLKQIVTRTALSPEAAKWLKVRVEELRADEEGLRKARIEALEERLRHLKQRLSRAFEALSDGSVDDETYKGQTAQWRTEKENLEVQIRELQRSGNQAKLDQLQESLELAETLETAWDSALPLEKAKLARSVCLNLTVSSGTVGYSLAFPFNVLADNGGEGSWCERGDLNPYAFRAQASKTCVSAIPPLSRRRGRKCRALGGNSKASRMAR